MRDAPVSEAHDHELLVTLHAARVIAEQLPEAVATAVIEFLTGGLLREPRRVGKPLSHELAGVWSATRRGTYRVLYRIREHSHKVIVLRVEHRSDAYRPR